MRYLKNTDYLFTGISHTTLWRLKKRKALGINFITLEKIWQALECVPGDVLKVENMKKTYRKSLAETIR